MMFNWMIFREVAGKIRIAFFPEEFELVVVFKSRSNQYLMSQYFDFTWCILLRMNPCAVELPVLISVGGCV